MQTLLHCSPLLLYFPRSQIHIRMWYFPRFCVIHSATAFKLQLSYNIIIIIHKLALKLCIGVGMVYGTR